MGALCADYLTEGVVAERRWLGLVGRGGLVPLVGVCPEDWGGPAEPSGLKAFMSCATLPLPAHGGVPFPEERASSEADRTVTRDGTTFLQLGVS